MNPHPQIEGARQRGGGCALIAAAVLVALFSVRYLASLAIDYQWWKEMGQFDTWVSMWTYMVAPTAAGAVIAFIVLLVAHARALKYAGTSLSRQPLYAKLSTLVLLAVAIVIALAALDNWTVVRYFGGRSLGRGASEWHDPVFHQPLAFYFFDLPFYSDVLSLAIAITVAAAIIYWLAARGWQLRHTVRDWPPSQGLESLLQFNVRDAMEVRFARLLAAVFLIVLAVRFFLSRYGMLLNEHDFMTGIDYVNENFSLPLQWVLIAAFVAAAVLVMMRWFKTALAVVIVGVVLRAVIPPAVTALYVRPNEISLEKPFINRHIQATRAAYGIDSRTREIEVKSQPDEHIDIAQNRPLLDNVRLWDWRAFRETVAQIQPLRPYVYSDVDVERYTIGGDLRQVLVAPRELDLNSLGGEAQSRWINTHFIYTHGYGLVMAEANKITENGLPQLFIKDAPPEVTAPGLKLVRPELYYSESAQDPVFVHTAQAEFNYPAGERNEETFYSGQGGFPISSVLLRGAAAIAHGDWNILLTGYLKADSRMMIHRRIADRLSTLAPFLTWDSDPYLVLGGNGRLVWIVDGYMTSDLHPYSQSVDFEGAPPMNYIRNSVKATIDAYDGTVKLYVFDPSDPLIGAYRNLFPHLFLDASAMPASLRAHVRYPEMIFRAQAEIYRTFHMRDPETFYNKSDAWDVAKITAGSTEAEPMAPAYVVATLPGETKPEFLLLIPFTPRNRDNLIGLMIARCDGAHLGEKVVLMLPKQQIFLGPLQVQARINQDQNISKDLTLWNQQGSQVLRGEMLVLPIENTFLYVEPFYLQAAQAKMPQLKKIVLAVGNTLVYTDNYEEALAQLGGTAAPPGNAPEGSPPGSVVAAATPTPGARPAPPAPQSDPKIMEIRQHLNRYQELVGQGKWAEAGKELEAVRGLVGK